MMNCILSSAFCLITILHQQIVNASIIRPKNPSQGATSGEETELNSSIIPKSLSLDDVDNKKVPSQSWVSGAHPLRGGSCVATKAPPDDVASSYAHGRFFAVHSDASVRTTGKSNDVPSPPKAKRRGIMDYESIALALRLTCEINRRLDCATAPTVGSKTDEGQVVDSVLVNQHLSEQYQSSESSTFVHVHPSQAWQRPIRDGAEVPSHDSHGLLHDQHQFFSASAAATVGSTPCTTLFDTPQRQRADLTSHVKHIAEILEYDPIIPAMALLFLDRASSVETSRGDDRLYGAHHHDRLLEKTCPYLTPQSVHKMYLTAVILAHRTVRDEFPQHQHALFQDEYTQFYAELLTRGGIEITTDELGKMTEWMFHSLGTEGLSVSRSEVDRLVTSWKGLFVSEDAVAGERESSYRDGGIYASNDHEEAFDEGYASWAPPIVPWGTTNHFVNTGMEDFEHTWDHYQQDEEHQTLEQQLERENSHEEYILRQG